LNINVDIEACFCYDVLTSCLKLASSGLSCLSFKQPQVAWLC